MATTPNLDLPQIPQNALQISTPYNEAMQTLDGVVQCGVIDVLNDPPATANADIGRCWLVGTAPTGAFVSHSNSLAMCVGENLWKFFAPGTQVKYFLNLANGGFYKYEAASQSWVLAGGLGDAPNDDKTYGRKSQGWVEVGSSAAVQSISAGTGIGVDSSSPAEPEVSLLLEAGSNVELVPGSAPNSIKINATGGSGGGIPEAPTDGKQYARQNGQWTEVVSGGDVARSLTVTTTGTDDPYSKYSEWETAFGFSPGSNDYPAIAAVTDDAAFLLSIGGQQKPGFPPFLSLGSEGHLWYEFPGSPGIASQAPTPLPPDTNRAYWSTSPHPRKGICFHPDGSDAESKNCIAKYTPNGVIIRGLIAFPRGGTNGVKFAAKFDGGSWELYLANNLLTEQCSFMFLEISGPDSAPTYSYIGAHPKIPVGGFLKAEYK